MDQNQHDQLQNATRGRTRATPTQTHAIPQYQSNPTLPPPPPPNQHPPAQVFAGPFAVPSPYIRDQQQYAHHHYMLQQEQELQQNFNSFRESQFQAIEQTTHLRNHSLPLARIKKIMKSDEDVKMISAEAPVVLAKACDMFIVELTTRAWANAEENKRRTLQKNDIAAAVTNTEVFDFLIDVVPRDETMDLDLYSGIRSRGVNINNIGVGPCQNNFPYYYLPPQHVVGPGYMPPQQHVVGPPHPLAAAQVYPKQDHSADSEDRTEMS